MKWLSIKNLAKLASAKLTHKILTTSQLAVLAHRILTRINHNRRTRNNGPFQLGPRPAGIGRSGNTKYQYRPNAYAIYNEVPQIIKDIKSQKIFKKRFKRYLKNNDDLPTNRSSDPADGQNHADHPPAMDQ